MYDYSTGTTNAAPWRSLITVISYIVVEEGVTSIGNHAFACGSLESTSVDISVLTLPSTMQAIATWAFVTDNDIKCVFYNGTKTDFDNYGFKSVAELINSNWYFGSERYTDDGVTYALKDGNAVVAACATKKTGKVTIPEKINGNTVTEIAYRAFYDCNYITEVVLPDTVTVINEDAFRGCARLNTVNIPTGLTTLGVRAFYCCYALRGQINIPEGVTEISSECFESCKNLTTVTLPGTLTKISNYAFCNTGIKNVYYSCNCDKSKITIEGNNTPINNATWYIYHSVTKTDAKAVSCTEDGNNEYYYCSNCEKYFKDKAGTKGTTLATETITAIGHSMTKIDAKKVTCTDDGNNEYYYCSNCKNYFKEGAGTTKTTVAAEVIAAHHNMTKIDAKRVTCTEDGNNEYYYCSDCEKYFKEETGTTETTVADEVITAIGHSMTKIDAKKVNCTEDGNNEYYYCSGCEKYFKDEAGTQGTTLTAETITAIGHSMTKIDAKRVTCTDDGNNEYYYCSNCEKYFKEEAGTTETTVANEVITALGHSMTKTDAKAATCTEDGNNEYYYCSNCEKYFKEEAGTTETTVADEVITAIGHDWDAGTWNWSEDGKTASITFVCKNNKNHTETVNATVEGTEKTAPTCCDKGTTTYTAKATFNNNDYTDTKDVEDIKATGNHNWSEWTDGLRACQNENCEEVEECTHEGVNAGETCPTCGTVLPETNSSYSVAALIAAIITLFLTLFGFIAVNTAA